jgi:hypothetical protein
MNVERLRRRATHRLDDDRSEGDIRHEAPVHYIDMNPIGMSLVDSTNLVTEPAEIGG